MSNMIWELHLNHLLVTKRKKSAITDLNQSPLKWTYINEVEMNATPSHFNTAHSADMTP